MKYTGVSRRIDNCGRVVVPREIMDDFGWKLRGKLTDGTALDIYTIEDGVVLKEHKGDGCILCKSSENLGVFKGKKLCAKCRKELTEL